MDSELDHQLKRIDEAWPKYREGRGSSIAQEEAEWVLAKAKHLAEARWYTQHGQYENQPRQSWEELSEQAERLDITNYQRSGLEKRIELLYRIGTGERDMKGLSVKPARVSVTPDQKPRLRFNLFGHEISVK